jgi:hypothetical protein
VYYIENCPSDKVTWKIKKFWVRKSVKFDHTFLKFESLNHSHNLQVNKRLCFSSTAEQKQALSDHVTKLCNEDHLAFLSETTLLLPISDRVSWLMELMKSAVEYYCEMLTKTAIVFRLSMRFVTVVRALHWTLSTAFTGLQFIIQTIVFCNTVYRVWNILLLYASFMIECATCTGNLEFWR